MTDLPERLVGGRYALAAELGRGGMGTVWSARDLVLERAVALKEVALPTWVDGEERERAYQRVLREARAAARLHHPSVITIHDVVMDDGRPWIVMELLAAVSLDERLKRAGSLPEGEVAGIGLKVLDALRTAHEAGITHRDVKPGNVLLLEDGGVVLSDFGIAHVDNSASITSTGMLMGSPAFMAPERLEGRRATAGSDLWSLGATLYTAVEGASPYQGPTPVAVMGAILMAEPRPTRRADLLREVIAGLMAKDPAERLGHEEARDALEWAAAAGSADDSGRSRTGSAALAALVRRAEPPAEERPKEGSEGRPQDRPEARRAPRPLVALAVLVCLAVAAYAVPPGMGKAVVHGLLLVWAVAVAARTWPGSKPASAAATGAGAGFAVVSASWADAGVAVRMEGFLTQVSAAAWVLTALWALWATTRR
ncbi:serine/threonine-protein kinase [Nonomuraea sp. NPDC050556]|uniref:serine/threonine-protein kinase n=1 Tax=Nonomuraea sp. NPDC050556 TaxID=3364369 RepID=UPI0037AE8F41